MVIFINYFCLQNTFVFIGHHCLQLHLSLNNKIILLGELYVLWEVFQSPQTEVPYPQTNGGQPRLGKLVAVVHISVTCLNRIKGHLIPNI